MTTPFLPIHFACSSFETLLTNQFSITLALQCLDDFFRVFNTAVAMMNRLYVCKVMFGDGKVQVRYFSNLKAQDKYLRTVPLK